METLIFHHFLKILMQHNTKELSLTFHHHDERTVFDLFAILGHGYQMFTGFLGHKFELDGTLWSLADLDLLIFTVGTGQDASHLADVVGDVAIDGFQWNLAVLSDHWFLSGQYGYWRSGNFLR